MQDSQALNMDATVKIYSRDLKSCQARMVHHPGLGVAQTMNHPGKVSALGCGKTVAH